MGISICSVAVKAEKNHSTIGHASHQDGRSTGVVRPRQASAQRCGSMLSGIHGSNMRDSGIKHKHKKGHLSSFAERT